VVSEWWGSGGWERGEVRTGEKRRVSEEFQGARVGVSKQLEYLSFSVKI